MSEPLVSILLMSYQHRRWVVEALESIKNQTYNNIELIILDDGSTDGTPDIIDQWISLNYPSAKFIKNEKNSGSIPKNLNKMLKMASGQYIVPFASDDVMLNDRISSQIKIIYGQNDISLVYGDVIYIDEQSTVTDKKWSDLHWLKDRILMDNHPEKILFFKNFIAAASIMICREHLEKLGGWDESLFLEDYPMSMALAQIGKVKRMDAVVAKYRQSSTNLTHTKIREFPIMVLQSQRSHIKKFNIDNRMYEIINRIYSLRQREIYIYLWFFEGKKEIKNWLFLLTKDLSFIWLVLILANILRLPKNWIDFFVKYALRFDNSLKINNRKKNEKILQEIVSLC